MQSIVTLAHELKRDSRSSKAWRPERDAAWLKQIGCEYAQGFYFSAPLPAAEALNFIAQPLPDGRRPRRRMPVSEPIRLRRGRHGLKGRTCRCRAFLSAAAHLASMSASKMSEASGIAMDPAIGLDFVFDLARSPAGIAEREQRLLRARAFRDGAQDIQRCGQRNFRRDGQG